MKTRDSIYKYEKIEYDKNRPIFMNRIQVKNPERKVSKHWHQSLEIIMPIKGAADLWINGKEECLKEGDFYIINSKDIHQVKNHGQYYEGYVLQIKSSFLTNSYGKEIRFEQINNPSIKDKVKSIIEDLWEAYQREEDYERLHLYGDTYSLLYLLLSTQLDKKETSIIKSSKYRQRVADIAYYIEEHYKDDLSIDVIAKHYSLSKGYLSKLFKENLGLTLGEYVTKTRLQKAYQSLIETDEAIIDIAYEHGFPNLKSFYNAFKKEYHMTPLKYRKMMRK